jgi:hypothetical protein
MPNKLAAVVGATARRLEQYRQLYTCAKALIDHAMPATYPAADRLVRAEDLAALELVVQEIYLEERQR